MFEDKELTLCSLTVPSQGDKEEKSGRVPGTQKTQNPGVNIN